MPSPPRFAERAAGLKTAMPDEQVHLASVVDRDTIDHVGKLIDDAVAKGGTVLTGGAPAEGTIMPATIVSGRHPGDVDLFDESFGPVTTLIRARDEEHAIEIANDTKYGLTCIGLQPRHPARWRSPSGSTPGSPISTAPRWGTRRRCPSAAPRPRATVASAALLRSTNSPSCAGSPSKIPGQHYPI